MDKTEGGPATGSGDAILVERSADGVATIWLNNPAHRNALSNAMIEGLCETFPRLAADESCVAIVLRGRGGVFCAGRELREVMAHQNADASAIARIYGRMQTLNEVIYFSPHPVVAVVERYAFGIATMLVSWSDIAIAEASAQFGYPEVRHGITPYGAIPTMLNTMNQKAMLDLLLTGRRIDATEALRLGILSRVVAGDALEGTLAGVLDDLKAGSAGAIRRSKQFVRECETLGYREGITAATDRAVAGARSPDILRGISTFLGPRKVADP
jgi:enoyl-CoA hydratase/carnithine racemase